MNATDLETARAWDMVLTPEHPSLRTHLKEFIRHREIFRAWITRDLKVRYKQSLLGAAWAILQPLLLTVLMVLVFSMIVRVPSDGIPYPIFAYTALLPWTFFTTAITFGTMSLVSNMSLVSKIYFPREVLPLSAIVVAFVDFIIASIVLVVLILIYRVELHATILWAPIILLVQIAFMMGVLFFTSSLNAFYRDIRFVIPLAMQAWMYATPIIYPLSSVPDWILPLYLLNPMAGIIDSYRRVVLQGLPPDVLAFGIAIALSIALLPLGYRYFKRSEAILPDVI